MTGMAKQQIEPKADKGQFLTLAELEAFAATARRDGATGTEIISAGVSFGQKLQKLSVDVEIPTGGAVRIDKA